jgi:hypothetical protein
VHHSKLFFYRKSQNKKVLIGINLFYQAYYATTIAPVNGVGSKWENYTISMLNYENVK